MRMVVPLTGNWSISDGAKVTGAFLRKYDGSSYASFFLFPFG